MTSLVCSAPLRMVPKTAAWAAVSMILSLAMTATARAERPQWIWSAAHDHQQAPAATCFFRKTFEMSKPASGEIEITGDDGYELFVNGRRVGTGTSAKQMDHYDVTKYLTGGTNAIGVRVANAAPGPAGLVAIVTVKDEGHTHVSHSTAADWKASLKEFPHWEKATFDDSQWTAGKSAGVFGLAKPWGESVKLTGDHGGRFRVTKEFRVEWVIEPEVTGSLIAMAFNEFGQIVASRENGPLLLIYDKDKNGVVDTAITYCEQVKNCQGILPLNGDVLVTGDGPEGPALYRLVDDNHDGQADTVKTLLKFTGKTGEHAAHALTLGPDGMVYVVLGNHTKVAGAPKLSSPYHHFYEGDLLTPRFEDPGGHAVGQKAPGGTVIRTDTKGTFFELYAGGLRNAYDIAFTNSGDLITFDSDMEWDIGLPWYRPTRINHVIPGAEFGWRSGWAKWPEYYHDSLPAVIDLQTGSPTGMVVYNHVMFPQRYQNVAFVGDWARGRILTVKLDEEGGSLKADAQVFVEGRPMNVTDLAVGPDGWLYFATGGRDTEGGIYRVVWTGNVPPSMKNIGTGMTAAIRQPQFYSAFARQAIAGVKLSAQQNWEANLEKVATDARNLPEYRTRALDLLQSFGPFPKPQLLVQLAADRNPRVRAKAAYLMGIHANNQTGATLVRLLDDPNATVQRKACEALARSAFDPPAAKLVELLSSRDRFVAWAARRKLEQIPPQRWQAAVFASRDHRALILGSTALLTVHPDRKTALAVLDRSSQVMKGFVNDPDFIDLLRLIELALLRGNLTGEEVPTIRGQLAEEYPSGNAIINRELVRLNVYLQSESVTGRMIQQLTGEIDDVEKLHLAAHAPFLKTGWTTEHKLEILKFYERARKIEGGYGLSRYMDNISREFFKNLTAAERQLVLSGGEQWPSSALGVLVTLPVELDADVVQQLHTLDTKLASVDTDAARRLRVGIVAVLGRSKDAAGMTYLRQVFEREPARRDTLAMALAQDPGGENWPLLVRSLSTVEGVAAQEVLQKLAGVAKTPDDAQPLRQVILRGLKLGEQGGQHAVTLLERWSGVKASSADVTTADALAQWQQWFAKTYPDQPPAELPVESPRSRWTYQELLNHLSGDEAAHADAARGAAVFAKAQCAKCHRYGTRGEGIGPDLTHVSRRFQKKEILESIVFPSQVISDQYAGKTVLTTGGKTYSGIVAPGADGSIVILQASAEKVTLAGGEVDEILPNKTSAMPDSLLNDLTLEEISDLFAYMASDPSAVVTRRKSESPK